MNLRAQPYRIDFIGNKPEYIVKTSPYHTEGRRYERSFAVRAIVSGSFNLHTPHGNYYWDVSTADRPDIVFAMKRATTAAAVIEQLQAKLLNNYDINLFYAVTAELRQDDVLLTFTAREYGAQGNIALLNNSTPYTVENTVGGLGRTAKDGYKIVAWYEADGKPTPKLYFDDNAGSVRIGTDMLISYFGKPDIPQITDSIAHSCTRLTLNARLLFAEMEAGEVGVVKTSPFITLVNGTLEPYCAANNIPDWEPAEHNKFHQKADIDIFGQNNNDTVKTDIRTEQYLYVANFTGSDIANVPLTLTTMAVGGEETESVADITFPANAVTRVSVGAEALGIDNRQGLLSYTVAITHGGTTIARHFLIVPRQYNARTFLLENRVGVYESFVFANISVEKATNGERAVTQDIEHYILDDSNRQFTARTGMRTAKELRLLEQALDKDNNLLLDGQYAWRISVVPGSYTVIDESEDLIEVEMQFVLTEKVNRAPIHIQNIEPATKVSLKDNIFNQIQSL